MNKKRVGLVTLYGLYNFGNRLQNYAAQTVLEGLGCDCDTLVPRAAYLRWGSLKSRVRRLAASLLVPPVRKLAPPRIKRVISREHWSRPYVLRGRRIAEFNRRYVNIRAVAGRGHALPPSLADEYALFFTGSDQVFNPHWFNENFLLSFARPNQRRCFSPSFGVSELPEKWQKPFGEALSSFPQLGAREQAGADIIRALTGREAAVTLDPTLLLDRARWDKVATPPAAGKKEHMLFFLLGEASKEIAPEKMALLKELADSKNLEIIEGNNPYKSKQYIKSPGDFLRMIRDASLVVTDSFHVVVFSVIFERPFLLVDRIASSGIDMSSRTKTLLAKLQIEHRLPQNQAWDEQAIFNADYTAARPLLQQAKDSTISFLKESLR